MSWGELRASYDTVARAYDAQFRDELAGKPRDRELLEAFAAAVDDPVVDLGSGPGQIGRSVHDHGRYVVGLDLSPAMAALAGARLDAAGVADLRHLPLASARVGGIVAFYSLIHVPREQLASVVRELHRVLRPGGRLLLTAHEGEGLIEVDELLGEPVPFVATLFGLDELVAACTDAGLDVILAERRPPEPTEHPTFRLSVLAERPSAG